MPRIGPTAMRRTVSLRKYVAFAIFFSKLSFIFQVDLLADAVRASLYKVGEGLFHLAELGDTEPEETGDNRDTGDKAGEVNRACGTEDAPPETIDDADQRIQTVEQPPFLGDDAAAKTHRRNIETELDKEWNDVAEVAILHVQRCNP